MGEPVGEPMVNRSKIMKQFCAENAKQNNTQKQASKQTNKQAN